MAKCDIESIEHTLDDCVLKFGIHITLGSIVLPFIGRTELFSYASSEADVHFAVTALRRKLILGIESVPAPSVNAQSALLFLQKGEHYDLMLLYTSYRFKQRGMKTYYLGTNVPAKSLHNAIEQKKPDLICTYLCPGQKISGDYFFLDKSASISGDAAIVYGKAESLQTEPVIHVMYYADLLSAKLEWA
ncbi:hypothetical protein GCM10023184_45680 [Flaviaesturariibacter amylovorans]|uniref:Uncharacterized protein n=2 Tax=Flaviaesturariibacter amylovorans TaxID=1084520 RepID=A0ABP8HTX9_9BACT